ncbi:MAG: carbon-nitrogen hydrolase family protein [Gordonia sp. (in: high G+C Gram-positive bacteria)]
MQHGSTPGDVGANLTTIHAQALRARDHGAQLLITPEMFVTGYNIDTPFETLVEGLTDRVGAVAAETGIALAAGMPVRHNDDIGNAVVLFGSDGVERTRYVKTHMFSDLDRRLFTPGSQLPVLTELAGVTVGFLICYDVEFPEAVRVNATAGADLIIVPTAQMHPFEFVAETVLPTRAWDNQTYLAYVNHVGSEKELTYVGRSGIYHPDGSALAGPASADHSELLIATIDPAVVAAARSANPYLTDRRPELYDASTPTAVDTTVDS